MSVGKLDACVPAVAAPSLGLTVFIINLLLLLLLPDTAAQPVSTNIAPIISAKPLITHRRQPRLIINITRVRGEHLNVCVCVLASENQPSARACTHITRGALWNVCGRACYYPNAVRTRLCTGRKIVIICTLNGVGGDAAS